MISRRPSRVEHPPTCAVPERVAVSGDTQARDRSFDLNRRRERWLYRVCAPMGQTGKQFGVRGGHTADQRRRYPDINEHRYERY